MRKLRSEILIPVSICAAITFVAWQIFTAEAQVRVNPTNTQTPTYLTVSATTANLTGVVADSGQYSFLSVGHMSVTGMLSTIALRVSNTGTFTTVVANSATFDGMIATTISLGGTALSAWPAGSDLTNPGPIGGGTPSTGAFTSLTATTGTFTSMISTSAVFTNVTATSATFVNVYGTSTNFATFAGVSGVSVVKSNDKGHPIWLGTITGADTAVADNVSNFTSAQLVSGASFVGIVATSNTTTTPTLNVNGTGAKNVKRQSGIAVKPGDLEAGGIFNFTYDGTQYVLHNPSAPQIVAISGTRAMNASSGNVAYTGVGFRPRIIYFYGAMDPTAGNITLGIYADGAYGTNATIKSDLNSSVNTSYVLNLNTAAISQVANVTSRDADGFTLNWAAGSPSGALIGYFTAICIK